MKKIEAIVRDGKVTAVKEAVKALGLAGMTVSEVKGHGTQKGITEIYRDRSYSVHLISKVKFEIIVADKDVDKVTKCIVESARTGSIGDGKIFIYPCEEVIRIRTGESGDKAV
jgi:nitrogen regulatory protein P-II 1